MRSMAPGRRRLPLSGDTEAPGGTKSLVGFLNAPLIGLQPFVRGPLYSQAIDCYWRSFTRFDREAPFWIQRTLPKQFRNIVAREARVSSHVVEDPREVPEHLRSERWTTLCRGIENWNDSPIGQQARLAALLHALCFYPLTLKLTSQRTMRLTDADGVLLAYWRASAAYMMDLPSRVSDYSFADMSDFEAIARDGRAHPTMQFLSSIKLLVHHAKIGGRSDVLRAAAARVRLCWGRPRESVPSLVTSTRATFIGLSRWCLRPKASRSTCSGTWAWPSAVREPCGPVRQRSDCCTGRTCIPFWRADARNPSGMANTVGR